MIESLRDLVDEGSLAALAAQRTSQTFTEYLEAEIHTDSGSWSYTGHEALRGIFELLESIVTEGRRDATVCVLKAEQVGVSTGAIALATWLAARRGRNVGYFLPTDKFASSFAASRVNPIVERSSFLKGVMKDSAVERAQLKEMLGHYLYMLGLESMLSAISIPMDFQLFDEVDLIPELNMSWAEGRLAASDLAGQFYLSAPYRPGAGIDQMYHDGSQRRWLVSCRACDAAEICLEEVFPDCMREFSGRWVVVCPTCKRKLDVEGDGRWVARYPEREAGPTPKFSFRLSALAVPAIDTAYVMKRYQKALREPHRMPMFNRAIRALADAGNLQPITDAELRTMKLLGLGTEVMVLAPGQHPRFFGMDMGNVCHFWCEEYLPSGRPRLVWAERISSDNVVARTNQLIALLQPDFGVIDERPLLTDARKIAYANPRRVAVQEFVNGRELTLIEKQQTVEGIGTGLDEYGPKYLCVQVDRNDSLDQLCAELTHPERGLVMPAHPSRATATEIEDHLKKLQKEPVKDARGNDTFKFLDNVANHYGMAANSARIARMLAPKTLPFAFTPVQSTHRRSRNTWGMIRG